MRNHLHMQAAKGSVRLVQLLLLLLLLHCPWPRLVLSPAGSSINTSQRQTTLLEATACCS
jgi:hypothetical protein